MSKGKTLQDILNESDNEWKYASMDKNEDCYLYTEEPNRNKLDRVWVDQSGIYNNSLEVIPDMLPTCDWKDSLIERDHVVKSKPIETTMLSVLDASSEKYICAAMDENGAMYVYQKEAKMDINTKDGWDVDLGYPVNITELVDVTPTCDWKDSLIFRTGYKHKEEEVFPFKPFDRVLVRGAGKEWHCCEFSHIYRTCRDDDYIFRLSGRNASTCITAYFGNEDIVGTTKESNSKVWSSEDFK